LIKPIKILGNFLTQPTNKEDKREQHSNKKDLLEKEKSTTIKIDGKLFIFKGYSEDFSKLIVKNENDEKETFYELRNNKNFIINNPPEKSFTSVELDLLSKGKTIIVSNQNPSFKILKENGHYKYMTISKEEFIKNISQKINQDRSQKEKNRIKI